MERWAEMTIQRMIDMAQNAPFHHRKYQVMDGCAAKLIADCPQIFEETSP